MQLVAVIIGVVLVWVLLKAEGVLGEPCPDCDYPGYYGGGRKPRKGHSGPHYTERGMP